ncbi:hypothetical protein EIN_018310 [Entamoeba invadens IP1]|uniref:hypothetical protein n=1 Tax=Entamoeba invadens IP1 TaxID=370355 RepID=UPI0002C3D993|nr:hypothetical protein EIN_018310 [Entamoeba invadens IP1]ELP90482.1 hypothetical protein EIN_018310 [Entamoeba invadens IP1]|eukprot:XP_004257253.1 hypothetical protein EIN_018310 [Entamoeba invadens IP1]
MEVTFSIHCNVSCYDNVYIVINGKEKIMEWTKGYIWRLTNKFNIGERITWFYEVKNNKRIQAAENVLFLREKVIDKSGVYFDVYDCGIEETCYFENVTTFDTFLTNELKKGCYSRRKSNILRVTQQQTESVEPKRSNSEGIRPIEEQPEKKPIVKRKLSLNTESSKKLIRSIIRQQLNKYDLLDAVKSDENIEKESTIEVPRI